MVWPDGHGMVYGIGWRSIGCYMAWPGGMTYIWYGLAGMAWYMVWPGGDRMVYVLAWRGVAGYMLLSGGVWHGIWYGLSGMT